MQTNWKFLGALGFAHGASDAVSGYTLAAFAATSGSWIDAALVIFIYNVVAFALQPIFGYVVDRTKGPWPATIGGVIVMGLGLVLAQAQPLVGIGVLAVGSALFHVGAGASAVLTTPGRSIGAGIFTAPGVIGLSLGTIAGLTAFNITPLLMLAMLFAGFSLLSSYKEMEKEKADPIGPISLALALPIALLLLGAALRSTVWSVESGAFFDPNLILAFGVAAGLGKLFGSVASDRFGARFTATYLTALSLICFAIGSLPLLLLGVFLLQSSTPIILSTVVQRLPRFPATAAGLVVGFAIALGGLAMHLFSPEILRSLPLIVLCILVVIATFSFGLRRTSL